jgi:PEP-CTERM motif-containing protein
MKGLRLSAPLIAATAAFVSSVACANVTYNFSASGVTENYAQQGTAVFNFSNDGSSLSITLNDTVNPTAAILSEITGLQFSLSAPASGMTLVSVTPTQVIDCSNTSSPCPSAEGTSPYGWGSSTTGTETALGAGFDGTSFAFQPFGIVNANYLSPTGPAGLQTPSTNPLLVGPVTFNFAITGLQYAPEVSNVVFAFGDPIFQPAITVPEPGSLALIALGILAAGWIRVRRR